MLSLDGCKAIKIGAFGMDRGESRLAVRQGRGQARARVRELSARFPHDMLGWVSPKDFGVDLGTRDGVRRWQDQWDTSHSVMPETPLDNVIAMFEALAEYQVAFRQVRAALENVHEGRRKETNKSAACENCVSTQTDVKK